MGNKENLQWEDDKSALLKQSRGYEIIDVAECIFSDFYVEYENPRYPEQSRAIGRVKETIFTLVYEFVSDEHGEFVRLITYWKASKIEKDIYLEEISKHGSK